MITKPAEIKNRNSVSAAENLPLLLVCGHKNPDTDSVCAAYCYASLKNRISGTLSARAIRCGSLNRQTQYIFEKAGVVAPVFVKNIYHNCADVMNRNPDAVKANSPLHDVFHLLDEKHVHAVPVVNNDAHFLGLVNINILTKRFLGYGHGRTEIDFDAHNVKRAFGTPALCRGTSARGTFSMIIGAFPFDGFCERLSSMQPEKVMLVVGDRTDIIEHALTRKVAIIILTGIKDPSHVALNFKESKTWVFSSRYDTIETYRRLMLSMPVESVMSQDTPTLSPDSPISEASAIFADHLLRGIPIIENNRLAGLITRTDLLTPKHKKLILVDHNELAQAIDGAADAEIVEIIDHHRIGALTTMAPIDIFAKPVGSTCSLIYQKYRMHGIPPRAEEAKLLLSGIISDTLALRSPTTTAEDREALAALCPSAGIADWVTFANDIFSNSSNLLFEDLSKVVCADLKFYTEKGVSVGIAQIEVVDMDEVAEVRERLIRELDSMRISKSLDWAMILITDIIHANSALITSGVKEADNLLKYAQTSQHYFALPGVLSRKKQLLPEVLRVIDELAAAKKS